jgi:hypothetical protein
LRVREIGDSLPDLILPASIQRHSAVGPPTPSPFWGRVFGLPRGHPETGCPHPHEGAAVADQRSDCRLAPRSEFYARNATCRARWPDRGPSVAGSQTERAVPSKSVSLRSSSRGPPCRRPISLCRTHEAFQRRLERVRVEVGIGALHAVDHVRTLSSETDVDEGSPKDHGATETTPSKQVKRRFLLIMVDLERVFWGPSPPRGKQDFAMDDAASTGALGIEQPNTSRIADQPYPLPSHMGPPTESWSACHTGLAADLGDASAGWEY